MIRLMRLSVSGETRPLLCMTLSTVPIETFALLAISFIVTISFPPQLVVLTLTILIIFPSRCCQDYYIDYENAIQNTQGFITFLNYS